MGQQVGVKVLCSAPLPPLSRCGKVNCPQGIARLSLSGILRLYPESNHLSLLLCSHSGTTFLFSLLNLTDASSPSPAPAQLPTQPEGANEPESGQGPLGSEPPRLHLTPGKSKVLCRSPWQSVLLPPGPLTSHSPPDAFHSSHTDSLLCLLPPGLCICCFLILECSSPRYLRGSLSPSIRSLHKRCLPNETPWLA